MNLLIKSLRNKTQQLKSDLCESSLIQHRGERGSAREDFIRRFLISQLPNKFHFTTGAAFDRFNLQSKQIDILIVDNIYGAALFQSESTALFPCESVYGNIEVKSSLDGNGLKTSIENIRSLKILDREPTDSLDLSPHHRIILGSGLSSINTNKHNPYLGCVFAVNSLKARNLLDKLDEQINKKPAEKDLLPDCFFCLNEGYIALKAKIQDDGGIMEVPPGGQFDGYYTLQTGEDTLAWFYMTLIITLSRIRLRARCFGDLWSEQKEKVRSENGFNDSQNLIDAANSQKLINTANRNASL